MYCPETKTMDMTKRRVTDIKSNTRIMMPDPRGTKEEAIMMLRRERMMEAVRKYRREKCTEKGEIKESNVGEEISRGIKKINKRVKIKR